MNLLLATVRDGTLHSALGELPLAQVGPHGAPAGIPEGPVVVGIRPEDFEDAALAADRGRGLRVSARVDVLESTGADMYAHLAVDGLGDGVQGAASEALQAGLRAAEGEDGPASEIGGPELVARVDTNTALREGETGELWLDTTRLHLFDSSSGERIAA
jgi:multiple sugar transport system ATP-binding protein